MEGAAGRSAASALRLRKIRTPPTVAAMPKVAAPIHKKGRFQSRRSAPLLTAEAYHARLPLGWYALGMPQKQMFNPETGDTQMARALARQRAGFIGVVSGVSVGLIAWHLASKFHPVGGAIGVTFPFLGGYAGYKGWTQIADSQGLYLESAPA